MKLLLLDFVQRYKDILSMKKTHVTEKMKFGEIAVVVIILTFIAVGTGLITNGIKNLSYVVNVLNTIVIGSFIIYQVIGEIRFKEEHGLEYRTVDAVIVKCLRLTALVLFTSFITQVYLMTDMYSLVNASIQIGIVVLIYGLFLYVEVSIGDKAIQFKLSQLLMFGLYNGLLFLLIVQLIPVKNLMVSFIVTYLLIAYIWIYREMIYRTVYKYTQGFIVFLVYLVVFFTLGDVLDVVSGTTDRANQDFRYIIEDDIISWDRIEKTHHLDTIGFSDNYIAVVEIEGNIKIYDFDMKLVSTINDSHDYIGHLYSIGDTFYYKGVRRNNDTVGFFKFDKDSGIEEIGVYAYTSDTYYEVNDMTLITDDLYLVTDDKEFYDVRDVLDDHEKFYQDDEIIIGRNSELMYQYFFATSKDSNVGNGFDTFYYNRGQIFYRTKEEYVVCSAIDFTNHDIDNCMDLDYDFSRAEIQEFYVYDTKYFIRMKDYNNDDNQVIFLASFDEEGMYLGDTTVVGRRISGDHIIEEYGDSVLYTKIDTEPVKYVKSDLVTPHQFLSLSLITLLIYFGYPVKGGDRNDFYDFTRS